ncbi:hypothetical protein GLOIN_2v1785823 [Rhizophagus irregularis DAOM 181602=DAOM 197198]|nr:hypothetical protein GLOIN_2v1785823 [Rhizophagus irregularis DAOM 181602=DAOM 197198]
MLPTLTALQKCKPFLYPSDWLCSLCHFAPEDMNHLWTYPYIIPDASSRSIYYKLMLSFHDACITNFSELAFLSDSFLLEFSALDCWDFTIPSSSCLWLTRVLTSLLSNLHEQLYWDIWMPRNVFFHLWLDSQDFNLVNYYSFPVSYSSPSPLTTSGSSLATVSQDSWFSWISSSIIRV